MGEPRGKNGRGRQGTRGTDKARGGAKGEGVVSVAPAGGVPVVVAPGAPPSPTPALADSMVVLVNVSGQAFTINLTHEDYCRKAGECLCSWVYLRLRPQRNDGSDGVQDRKVRRNASLTILAKSKSRPLHRAVLDVPGVQTALRAPNRKLIIRNGG